MKGGALLIIFGTLAGSLLLALFLWKISGNLSHDGGQNSPIPGQVQTYGEKSEPANQEEGDKDENNPSDAATADCAISQSYPKEVYRWCKLITHYASQRKLSPDLVAAVILQESGGNPDAYSSSGAVGLMQVMPSDGLASSFLCANGPCFMDRPSRSKLVNPEFNLKYGTGMLARLHKNHGDLREALRYYGPMDVGYAYANKVLAIYDTHRQ